jgi:hypothetical protein
MNLRHLKYVAIVVLGFGVVSALAQSVPTPAPATQQTDIEATVLPELAFDSMPFDDVLDFLRHKVNGFNAVAVRDPGAPPGYPLLTNLKLRDVSLGQFMEFIEKSYRGVHVERIQGTERSGPLFVIHIDAVEQPGPPAGMIAGGAAPVGGGPGMQPEEPAVSVYRLSTIISALAETKSAGSEPEKSKQALNDVLSLVQAALEQTGEKPKTSVLKVHEPTQVLVFKGTPQENAIVREVLETLPDQPKAQDNKYKTQIDELTAERNRITRELDESMKRLQDARAEASVRQRELEQAKVELAVLRAQLDQAKAEMQRSTTRPKE